MQRCENKLSKRNTIERKFTKAGPINNLVSWRQDLTAQVCVVKQIAFLLLPEKLRSPKFINLLIAVFTLTLSQVIWYQEGLHLFTVNYGDDDDYGFRNR